MITEVSYETLQKKKTLVVDAVLSPTPRACRSCGSTVVDGNGKAIIVKMEKGNDCPFWTIQSYAFGYAPKSNAIPVKTVAPIGRLKVILSNPDIQSQIMLDIKLLLYWLKKYLYLLLRKAVRYLWPPLFVHWKSLKAIYQSNLRRSSPEYWWLTNFVRMLP